MPIKFEKPLIGIEWEPQVSLQKYPNYRITVQWGNFSVIKASRQKDHVYIYIPQALRDNLKVRNMYVDVDNMEIYTDPVPINKLNAEINHRYKILKEFWVLASSHLNQMIGVLLPASSQAPFVTKHVSMSYTVKPSVAARLIAEYASGKQRRNPYEPKFDIKEAISTYHESRVHLKVPYNFVHYAALYKSYLRSYHRGLLWHVFNEGKNVYTDSAIKAYLRNEDNKIESWFKDVNGWLMEYSQDNPMNEPYLLGIATSDRFAEKHKLI